MRHPIGFDIHPYKEDIIEEYDENDLEIEVTGWSDEEPMTASVCIHLSGERNLHYHVMSTNFGEYYSVCRHSNRFNISDEDFPESRSFDHIYKSDNFEDAISFAKNTAVKVWNIIDEKIYANTKYESIINLVTDAERKIETGNSDS